jgi:hypothetical protein
MRTLVLGVTLATALACAGVAAKPVPAPEASEAKFVRLTRQFEADPLGFDGKTDGAWLLQWVVDSPDVSVTACNVTGVLDAPDGDAKSVLVLLEVFGNAAWQLEHASTTELERQAAAARSVLRGYAAIRRATPDLHIATLDALAEKEAAGQLEAHLAPIVQAQCMSPDGGAK